MTLIGTKTYGKYCSGLIVSSKQWYDAAKSEIDEKTYDEGLRYSDNWGIYVMYGRFADKDGKTLSMPDGISPDIVLEDNPLDGYELGSPAETMLAPQFLQGLFPPWRNHPPGRSTSGPGYRLRGGRR